MRKHLWSKNIFLWYSRLEASHNLHFSELWKIRKTSLQVLFKTAWESKNKPVTNNMHLLSVRVSWEFSFMNIATRWSSAKFCRWQYGCTFSQISTNRANKIAKCRVKLRNKNRLLMCSELSSAEWHHFCSGCCSTKAVHNLFDFCTWEFCLVYIEIPLATSILYFVEK